MSSAEYSAWQAFARAEGPFGQKRADWRAAQVERAVMLAAGHTWEAQDVPDMKDLLLKFVPDGDAPAPAPVEAMIEAARMTTEIRKATAEKSGEEV